MSKLINKNIAAHDVNPPFLSVVMSSFNHAEYILESIDSLLQQSFQDFEIIIVDDASSDNSLEVINSVSDSRVKLVVLEKNRGVCNACNVGIGVARGKYIKIFASDDIALPRLFEKQINFIEKNPSYDAIFTGIEVINERGELLPKKTKRFERVFPVGQKTRFDILNHFFFKGNFLAAPTAMIRTNILRRLGGFDIRIPQAHDFDLWVRIALNGGGIHILPEKLVQYRRSSRGKNMSSNTARVRKRLAFDNQKVLERYLSIENSSELAGIFPDLTDIYSRIHHSLIPVFLAKQALKVFGSNHHKQFAVQTIYEALNDSEVVSRLEEGFEFVVNRDFFEIVEQNPIGEMAEKIKNNFCEKFSRKVGKIINRIFRG